MIRRGCLAGLVLAALPLAAGAADAPQFTLGKAVPADVYIYVHGAYNPEQDFLREHWGRVWQAFKDSGVVQDVHDLVSSSVGETERADFEKFWSKAEELIQGVDWQARVEELVYTSRMSAPVPEYLVLLRYEEGKAEKNGQAFAAVLKEIAGAIGEGEPGTQQGATFTVSESRGAKISTLGFKQVPFLSLRVAVRGPVVAFAMDRTMLDEALAGLAGEGGKPPLVESVRYRQAITKLPPPEDAVMFFDIRAIVEGIRGIMQFAIAQSGGQGGEPNPDAQEALRVVGKVLDEFTMFDHIASTSRTEGHQQLSETLVSLSADAERSRLYKVFKPDPVEKFDRFIPKEATAYSVSSGFDLSALYAAVIDFIDRETQAGKGLLAQWDQIQNDIGFRPDRDVFSWLGGQFISVTLPSATPSPFSSTDSVLFIKVRDEQQAATKIKAGLDRLNDFLASRNSPLTSQPASIEGAENFRMVTHPLIMMFARPVYGVADGYLVIGSSSKAIEACRATARGDRPSVAKNERVQKEGLVPKGAVASASFQDLTTLGRDIGQVLNLVAFVSALIPNEPELKPVRGFVAILGKLGPVAEKIDFIRSASSVSTFDGKVWHSKSIVTYRPVDQKPAAEQGS